jgi:eukaryotic-like serine/threonine-protein kinase
MESDHEQDERVMTLVAAALRLKVEDRESFIRIASGADDDLYRQAAETLEWEQRMGNFLQQPMITLEELVHPFAAGQVISQRFEIVREIGEGAMGVVYEAFDRKRNQRIAIKAAKPGFRRLLSPELEGALKVRHPNVCLVNEIHTAQSKHGEIDFLTMELLEGGTLSARLSACGELSVKDATEIARQLCAGLAEAHRMGVIHRDLKASNVMLCENAHGAFRAVITDFGLSGETVPSEGVCGTPRYIAPELWLGDKASKASDIYALGVIAFEMAAGRAPSGDRAAESHIQRMGFPPSYSRLVEECLSLEPERRRQAFERALQPNYWKDRSWSRRSVLAAGTGVVAALAGGVWLERNKIGSLLRPLPGKRFVALLLWPPTMDVRARPLVSGVIDAIENELSRAEAFDRNFFVVSSRDTPPGTDVAQIAGICDALGANLALEASGIAQATSFQLVLRVLDAKSAAVLRQSKIVCAMEEIASLASKAVGTAAGLLDVRWEREGQSGLKPATNSVRALRAFQIAEELRNRPNDDGLNEAIENYKIALDADPQYAAAYVKLAIAYCHLYDLNRDPGILELVQANAERAIRLDPASADAHLALSCVAEERGNEEQAQGEIRRALALDPTNPRTLLWQGELYHRFNRWADAEQTYMRLRKERPNYWPAYNDLGSVLSAQGKYHEALQAFHAATVAAPGSALAFNDLGGLFLKLGKLAEAIDSFQKSLKLKPSDVAYSNLAEAMRANGKYAEALPMSQEAVKLEPNDDQNWLDLADCYESLHGREGEAQEAYRRAATEVGRRLQTDPADGAAWIRLALYRVKSGSSGDVLLLLTKAGNMENTDVDTELIRARVLELLGKRKDAVTTLANCFEKGTTSFEVAYIKDFAALRKDPEYTRVEARQSNGSWH